MCAPVTVVQRIRNEILDAMNSSSNIILLTGETGKGKTTLLQAIGNKVAVSSRLIFFNGINLLPDHSANKDDPSKHSPLDTKSVHDFNLIKDFIFESANMEEKLTVIIDAADCLPAEILGVLLNINNQSTTNSHNINLILAGLPDFINQLNEIENASVQNFIHCSMDELNEEDIDAFAANKEYRNKPINGVFNFNQDALETLSDYVKENQQLLDVILEWCSSIVNIDDVILVTKDIVERAIVYAELFSKDKNIALTDSYPPAKDIDDYITGNELINEPQIKDTNTYKHVKSANKDIVFSSIPTITSQIDDIPRFSSNGIHTLEDEIMPTQWVSAPEEPLPSKKPFLSRIPIIFILIFNRIGYFRRL